MLLYIYGICLSVTAPIALVGGTIALVLGGHYGEENRLIIYTYCVGPGTLALGCLFLFAGRSLWQGRWRRGAIAAVLASTIYLGVIAAAQLLHLFP